MSAHAAAAGMLLGPGPGSAFWGGASGAILAQTRVRPGRLRNRPEFIVRHCRHPLRPLTVGLATFNRSRRTPVRGRLHARGSSVLFSGAGRGLSRRAPRLDRQMRPRAEAGQSCAGHRPRCARSASRPRTSAPQCPAPAATDRARGREPTKPLTFAMAGKAISCKADVSPRQSAEERRRCPMLGGGPLFEIA